MEYALIGCFNDALDQEIRSIWRLLKEKGLSNYGFEVEGKSPHISFADFVLDGSVEIVQVLDEISKEHKPIKVSFPTVKQFLDSTTLYFECDRSIELLKVHSDFHNSLRKFTLDESYYVPKHWKPHATIASRLGGSCEAVREIVQPVKLEGTIVKFVLIEMSERVEGIPQGFKEIWSKTL